MSYTRNNQLFKIETIKKNTSKKQKHMNAINIDYNNNKSRKSSI